MRRVLLIAAGLPPEIADRIERMVRDDWWATIVRPFEEAFRPVAVLKNILLPGNEADYYIDLDRIVGGWDDTKFLRNMAVLYNYCRFVQRVVNDSHGHKQSPLISAVWEQKKAVIARKYMGV